ncbi:hypothetical protein VZH09_00810 [Synechococcus elongatus IITB7]|uniref:hypothetical protein n=1 Tax=Synechococcus elongatus TaxID=32046 RepID=UPI0030D29FC5
MMLLLNSIAPDDVAERWPIIGGFCDRPSLFLTVLAIADHSIDPLTCCCSSHQQ